MPTVPESTEITSVVLEDSMAVYVHSKDGSLGDVEGWRINGVDVEVTRVSEDRDGSDVALAVPAALLTGDVTIEGTSCSEPVELTIYRSVAGPNQPTPTGCVCSSIYHKIYCPIYNTTYTWCTNCCGY